MYLLRWATHACPVRHAQGTSRTFCCRIPAGADRLRYCLVLLCCVSKDRTQLQELPPLPRDSVSVPNLLAPPFPRRPSATVLASGKNVHTNPMQPIPAPCCRYLIFLHRYTYAAMQRIYKHYDLPLHDPAIRLRRASFSSYAGVRFGLSGLYLLSSRVDCLNATCLPCLVRAEIIHLPPICGSKHLEIPSQASSSSEDGLFFCWISAWRCCRPPTTAMMC